MPILVVREPERPPTNRSRLLFRLIRNLKMSIKVSNKMSRLTMSFKLFKSIIKKTAIPTGNPSELPAMNLFKTPISTSFRTFAIKAAEMSKDKIKFICMASAGSKISRRNGVARMENPNPVLVWRIEAISMTMVNMANSIKSCFPLQRFTVLSFSYIHLNMQPAAGFRYARDQAESPDASLEYPAQ